MGHGELSASGLEIAAETVITVELRKGKKIAIPRVEGPREIMTIATGCPVERAAAQAFAELILWMESDFGWNRWRAYDILTHVARLSIGHYTTGTIAAKIERQFLEKAS
jgi:acetamidase/formamidase